MISTRSFAFGRQGVRDFDQLYGPPLSARIRNAASGAADLLSGSNSCVAALLVDGRDAAILCSTFETCGDLAGRSQVRVHGCLLSAPPSTPCQAVALVLGAFQERFPGAEVMAGTAAPIAELPPESAEDDILSAAASLAVSGLSWVKWPASASRVLELLGAWPRCALFVGAARVFPQVPPALVIAPKEPRGASAQLGRFPELDALTLQSLFDLDAPESHKRWLLSSLDEQAVAVAPPKDISRDSWLWLAGTPAGRKIFCFHAPQDLVADWLSDEHLSLSELSVVKSRIQDHFSPLASSYLEAALRLGTVQPADALQTVSRWNAEGVPRVAWQKVLGAAGLPWTPALEELASGHHPSTPLPHGWYHIVECGIVSVPALAKAVEDGMPVECLMSIPDICTDPVERELLDPRLAPPLAPPGCPNHDLDPIFTVLAGEPSFWRRWPLGVPRAVVAHVSLRCRPRGLLLAALVAAFQRRLDIQELERVVASLDREAICMQAAFWARDFSEERDAALAILLSQQRLSPDLRAWLVFKLTTAHRCPPIPDLTPAELVALGPLLSAEEIIRVVLDWPEAKDGEDDVLPHLKERRAELGSRALPRPSPDQIALRPAWVKSLARIANWKHWNG